MSTARYLKTISLNEEQQKLLDEVSPIVEGNRRKYTMNEIFMVGLEALRANATKV